MFFLLLFCSVMIKNIIFMFRPVSTGFFWQTKTDQNHAQAGSLRLFCCIEVERTSKLYKKKLCNFCIIHFLSIVPRETIFWVLV